MWLWRDSEKDEWSFDYGRVRVAKFVDFQNSAQFEPEANALAKCAANEVLALRQSLSSPRVIAERLSAAADDGSLWQWYHAAVAVGLLGNGVRSLELFSRIVVFREEFQRAWVLKLQNQSAELASKLSNIGMFRAAVNEIVQSTRASHGLRDDPGCLASWYR